ncbi:hypothetical protein [Brevibacillus centrosporus]|uniref:Uncharacterized protein n=1 Tax=Brevibacillus centrosporus TaxID=54910 RepID=A0A1I4D210_9BACL|nr:hypothetical protein [Brevibacillus centrosporus]SFK86769.1 hypothetical protein SAMN05518846_12222 [Brevibacillus centrosporus]
MRKQKWMMTGASMLVAAAMFVPGAFAKEKDDSYVAPSSVFGSQALFGEEKLPTYGPAHFFAPPENENNDR